MLRATLAGSAYVGVFARAIGDATIARADLDEEHLDGFESELGVPVLQTTIGGGSTVGSLLAGNRSGVVVSGQATAYERDVLEDGLARPVANLPDTLNAAGNVILANDNGAIVHPDLSEEGVGVIEDTLDAPVTSGTIGRVKTVGMAAVATANGVLCHPQANDEELERLESVLGVPADLGTVNYGSPLIGAGLIATEHGYVAGERTTGPELGRIEDALGLIG